MKLQPEGLPHQRSAGHIAAKDKAFGKEYHGGGEKKVASPWLYALHDVVKKRERTLRLLPLVWPKRIGLPNERILNEWMDEVESGEVKIDPKKRQWVKESLELDEQQAIREAVLETSQTLTHFAKQLREEGEPPPGGVVALKYLADAAGFLAGKRSEVNQQRGKERPISIGRLQIGVGEKPPPKVRVTAVKELPDGNG